MIRTRDLVAFYAVLVVAVGFVLVLAPGGVSIQHADSDDPGNASPVVDPDNPLLPTPEPPPSERVDPLRTVDGTRIYHPDDPGPTVVTEVDRSVTAPEYDDLAYHDNGSVKNETVHRHGVVVERRTFNSTAIERALEAEIDAVRRDHDLHRWGWSPVLASAARKHAHDMATHGFVGHTGTDGSTVADRVDAAWPGNDCRAGENVAEAIAGTPFRDPSGTVHDESSPLFIESNEDAAESFVRQWLNSEEHRDLLLHDEGDLAGVGVTLHRGERGEMVVIYAALDVCFR